MTITKLIMIEDRGFRYNPQFESLHINDEVARRYAEKKLAEGTSESIYTEWGVVVRHIEYKKDYQIVHLNVNEE